MEQAKKTILKFSTIILIITTLASCVSTQSLTIEIAKPAQKELPADIQSLTLVNRTVDENYQNLPSDSLQNMFFKKRFKADTVIYDIQAVDTTLKALGQLLYESGRYDYVIPVDRFLNSKKNSFLGYEMSWSEVKEICDTYNTDAVLSMDYYKTEVKTDYQRETYYDPMSEAYYDASIAQMQVNYLAMFRVYDPKQEKVLLREFSRDTLIWEDSDSNARELFKHFPPVKQALTEAGINMALDISDKISPVWRKETRTYFSSGPEQMEQGANLAKDEEWEQALTVWEALEKDTKSKSIKSKVQYNIAVGNEILGNIDDAVSWALKSYETMYRPQTYAYLELLKKRKRELKNIQP